MSDVQAEAIEIPLRFDGPGDAQHVRGCFFHTATSADETPKPTLNASGVLAAVKDIHKKPGEAHGWAYRMFWQYGVDPKQHLKTALEELVDGV